MFEIKNTFRPQLKNFGLARAEMHRQVKALFRDSVRAFVFEVAEGLSQHIDSGMSYASLMPLGGKVQIRKILEQALAGASFQRKLYLASGPFAGVSPFKSATHGSKLGQSAYVLNFGSEDSLKMTFEFRLVVLQWYLNENGLGNNDQPAWNFLDKGQAAFKLYWDQNKDRYLDGNKVLQTILTGRALTQKEFDLDG